MLALLAGCSSSLEEESLTATLSSMEREALKTLSNLSTGMGGGSSSQSSNKESNTLKSTSATLSVDFSQIDQSIATFNYVNAEILGEEEGKKLYNFSQGESNNHYIGITAIDHNHEHEEEGAPVGVVWYRDMTFIDDTSNSAIVASYLLLEDQTIDYENNTLFIKNEAGNPITGISKLQFGTPDQQCLYSFSSTSDQETETTEPKTTILFEICPVEIKAFDSTGTAHGFNGSLGNFSVTMDESDTTDFDINNPDYIVKRPLYNQSAKQVGYFEVNMMTGSFSVVDNNHQAL
jgi:hypothetical protein